MGALAFRRLYERDMSRSRTASGTIVVPEFVSLAPARSNNTVVVLKVGQYVYHQSTL
jgi:hypothetical protein